LKKQHLSSYSQTWRRFQPETETLNYGSQAVPELRRIVAGFPARWPWFEPRSGHVGFVVNKVTLGQVFSEYFGFTCQFSFHTLPHTHHLSSVAGTIGQLVAEVPSGLSMTEKNYRSLEFISKFKYRFYKLSRTWSWSQEEGKKDEAWKGKGGIQGRWCSPLSLYSGGGLFTFVFVTVKEAPKYFAAAVHRPSINATVCRRDAWSRRELRSAWRVC
jgi:hypothetical protein